MVGHRDTSHSVLTAVAQFVGRHLAAPRTWDRWEADRQHRMPDLGIPKVRGFQQVCAGRATWRRSLAR